MTKKKKSEANQQPPKGDVKSAQKPPRKLSPDDVRFIEKYHLQKELHNKSLQILTLERRVAQLESAALAEKLQKVERQTADGEALIKAKMNSSLTAYNARVEELKGQFGVKQLAYDPETFEILEE